METMLKKFKSKIQHILGNSADADPFGFENQNIELNGQNYLFCRAVVSTIPELLAVERAVYSGKTPIDYETFEKQLKKTSQNLVLLVRYEDRVVAYIACDYSHSEARITDIAIMPRFQKRGIAKKMLQIIIGIAKKLHRKRIVLDVRQSNLEGQKFYKDLGFKEERVKHRYFADTNEDAYQYGYTFKGEK